MLFARVIIYVLAIALPSLRTSPFLNRTWLVTMAAIVFLHTATFNVNVVIFSQLDVVWESLVNIFTNFLLVPNCALEEISLIFLSLVPVKPKRLTNLEKSQFTLSDELKKILVGLILVLQAVE